MGTNNFYSRLVRIIGGGGGLNASDTSDDVVTTPSSSGPRFAAGTGTLVSGAATISTGLANVTAFTASLNRSTGFASGATEVNTLMIGAITTGSVVVSGAFNAFVTGAATLSASGTTPFYWIAFGS